MVSTNDSLIHDKNSLIHDKRTLLCANKGLKRTQQGGMGAETGQK